LYIQVTTRCNMQCKHCKFACSPKRGKDMPLDVFRFAADIGLAEDEYITIGGGEPTLHPDLIFMLGYVALLGGVDHRPFMVTNGAVEERLWNVLVHAHEAEMLDLHVSRDPWHDEEKIPPYVWNYANDHKLWWGDKGTRTIEKAGRARRHIDELEQEASDYGYERVNVIGLQECGPRVDPDGIVWADVPKRFGGGKIGPIGASALDDARCAISEAENEGVHSNPHPSPRP